MAADSRSCSGDIITTDAAEKLVRGKDGSVIGCAGDRAACQLVREWFAKGANLAMIPKLKAMPDDPSGPFIALVLRPDGTVEALDHMFTFTPRDVPAAVGTGGEIALGCLLSGKTPLQAVEIAAGKVCTVGGRVHQLKPGKE